MSALSARKNASPGRMTRGGPLFQVTIMVKNIRFYNTGRNFFHIFPSCVCFLTPGEPFRSRSGSVPDGAAEVNRRFFGLRN